MRNLLASLWFELSTDRCNKTLVTCISKAIPVYLYLYLAGLTTV